MIPEPRKKYIVECRAYCEEVRARLKPWVMIVRDDHRVPINAEARDQQKRGMGYLHGRGRPIGIAVCYITQDEIFYGYSVCHPKEQFNSHVGLRKALHGTQRAPLARLLTWATSPCAVTDPASPRERAARKLLVEMVNKTAQAYAVKREAAAPASGGSTVQPDKGVASTEQ